jgi:hypothetical protein
VTGTITVVGEAGAVQTLDVPEPGTPAAELLDHLLETGKLTLVDGEIGGEAPARPDDTDRVAAWRAYAIACGADPDTVRSAKKSALIEEFGDAGESSDTVGADVPGEDLGADGDQLDPGEDPGAGEQVGDEGGQGA